MSCPRVFFPCSQGRDSESGVFPREEFLDLSFVVFSSIGTLSLSPFLVRPKKGCSCSMSCLVSAFGFFPSVLDWLVSSLHWSPGVNGLSWDYCCWIFLPVLMDFSDRIGLVDGLDEKSKSGFHPCHGTEIALIRMAPHLLLAADSGSLATVILLKLTAAFLSLPLHPPVLGSASVTGKPRTWFTSALSTHSQFIKLRSHSSNDVFPPPTSTV